MCVCVWMCVRCRTVLELLQYSIPYILNVYFKYVHFHFFCLCYISQHQILIRFVKERKQKQFPNFTSTSGDREALMNHVILWNKWEAAGVEGGPWDDQQYHEPMKFVCVENARTGGWWGNAPQCIVVAVVAQQLRRNSENSCTWQQRMSNCSP